MKAIIVWFANHSKAANLLVLVTMLGGIFAAYQLPKEIIPNIERDTIIVTTALAGANAANIEHSICTPLETAFKEYQHQKNIIAVSEFNSCKISIDLADNTSTTQAISDIKSLSAIVNLPNNASKPIIATLKNPVMAMRLAVSGNINYSALHQYANNIVEKLHAIGIENAKVIEKKSTFIAIVPSISRLQSLQMSLSEVAKAIQESGINIPVGAINTSHGATSVTLNTNVNSEQLSNIIVRSLPDGSRVLLGDIATIQQQETSQYARVNGETAVSISIYQGDEKNIFELSEKVHQLVQQAQTQLPTPIKLHIVFDNAEFFNARMDYLKSNFLTGLLVGGILLLLWLRLRTAFWITADIPIAFGGALIWLYLMDGSINMVSAFGFIIVLGIVCDDAIVIGENIHRHQSEGRRGLIGAISGATEVAPTVIFAVCTTIIMFLPLLFLPGEEGKLMRPLPMVVIAVLVASLIEALLVLPTHLAHQPKKSVSLGYGIANKLDQWVLSCYQPLLQKAIQYRYIVVSLCLALFLISVSLILAQQVPLRLLSDIQTEIATASVTLSNKTTLENDKTIEAVNRIEQAALDINKETEKQFGESAISLTRSFVASHSNHGEVYATLTHNTPLSNQEVMQLWKDKTGHIAQASQLSFQSSVNIDNAGFHLQLHSTNKEALTLASSAFIQHLEKIPGVLSVKNITSNQQTSIIATPNATANTLGISNQNIASQLHLALNGISSSSNTESAIKLQLEKNSFSHLADLSNLPIQISPTQTLALSSIATLKTISEDSRITRENGQHIAHIQADIDPNIIKPRQLLALAERDFLISMNQEFANVGWSTTGSLSAETEIKTYLIQSFIISLLVMFVFLAIFLNSYSQPILIFTAIPYGIVGALLGHFIFDQALTLWSFAGMIAVSGIVVNNNMVIIFFINEQLKAGHSILETVMQAGANRFRPIMLTTITTFTGVLPTILGNSWETQFLIPLAISIGCGVVFAALLTLLLVPCLYMIGDDFRNTNGPARPAQA